MSNHKVADGVESLIGQTPLVRLRRSLENVPVGHWLSSRVANAVSGAVRGELLAKVEFTNPGGSVKDRIALRIINEAERRGDLKPGGTIIEATSGNTGAGLALIAAARGYKAIFVMTDKISAEKINTLCAFGAKVVIVPVAAKPDHPDYYCTVAKRLAAETPGGFLANQYFSPDNPDSHYRTTGPEIWEQTEGRIDLLFAGIGTGGTLSGTARFLREKNPQLRVVAIDPVGSIYASLIREKKMTEAKPYLVEGVGEDMVPGTIQLDLIDDCVSVNDTESFSATRMLAQREGLLVGGSCGAAFFGAASYMRSLELTEKRSLRGVVILPDSGRGYLSKLFNPAWLASKNISPAWGDLELGGRVEYLPSANRVEGVK